MTTALVVSQARHSFYLQKFHPAIWFSMACLAMSNAYLLDYNKMYVIKVASYTAFCGLMGMVILPIVT